MLLSMTLFVVLSKAHQSLQQGIIPQMISASYKNIEVEYDSWIKASLYENKTLLTVKRPSNLMCASLCTADELCNAYHFNKTSFCTLGNAAKLVGVSPASKENEIIRVYINAALVPGKSSATKLQQGCSNGKSATFLAFWTPSLPLSAFGTYCNCMNQHKFHFYVSVWSNPPTLIVDVLYGWSNMKI